MAGILAGVQAGLPVGWNAEREAGRKQDQTWVTQLERKNNRAELE